MKLPSGYEWLDQVEGDLNLDGRIDHLWILRDQREQKAREEENYELLDQLERRAILWLAAAEGGWHSLKLDLPLGCAYCGGSLEDSYGGITIEKGTLTLEHWGSSPARWINKWVYQYHPDAHNWKLAHYFAQHYHLDDPEGQTIKQLSSLPEADRWLVPVSDSLGDSY